MVALNLKRTIYNHLPARVKSAGATEVAAKVLSKAGEGSARVRSTHRGRSFTEAWSERPRPRNTPESEPPTAETGAANPLEAFFDAHTVGRGIFKWRHYF